MATERPAAAKKRTPPKKSPGRDRASVTARSTSGVGFDFEDRVGASMLLSILRQAAIPGVGEAAGERLQTQVGGLGWKLDDMLVTAVSSQAACRVSISCKSNVQVSGAGLPAEFLEAAWSQWSGASPMNPATDVMLLATRGSHPDFTPIWADIKNWAGGDPELALSRVTGTAKHRRIFTPIKTAGLAVNATLSDAELLRFVRAVGVMPFDFQLADSKDEANAIVQCRELLDPTDSRRAAELWGALVNACRDARVGHGTIEIPELWAALRASFRLRERPHLQAAWKALSAIADERMQLIDVALPNGTRIDREAEEDALVKDILANEVVVIHGESGTGKSSLVKSVAHGALADWACVWLSPEDASLVATSAGRSQLHLQGSLSDLLLGSAKRNGVVVLDAAERLPDATLHSLRTGLREVIDTESAEGCESSWRVVVLSQTDALEEGRISVVAGIGRTKLYELGALSIDKVKSALRSTDTLGWLSTYDDAIAPLTNLRTLAFVVGAESEFQPRRDSVDQWSRTEIVDRIWRHWTAGKVRFHGLLVRLAIREASEFERSQAVSELAATDLETFDSRPVTFPIRNVRNRLQFVHDLAAEWARFQRLKEIANDVQQWAPLAANPFWTGALRLLGQSLLRTKVGDTSAWDVAFRELEGGPLTHAAAADVLLDSLYLDPLAERFLAERSTFFLEQAGRRLNRLLNRFVHTATTPVPLDRAIAEDRSMQLYVEARVRTPIIARWPAVARFLAAHAEDVGRLMSRDVALACHTWLSRTPTTFGTAGPVPLRREFAIVALATARAVQTEKLKGVIFLDDCERPIYEAALAGAPDLPQDVGAWALECAGRQRPDVKVMETVEAHRAQEAGLHAERIRTDGPYKDRHEAKRAAMRSLPVHIPSRRQLPPWPLGPLLRVDRHFREACVNGIGLRPMMSSDAGTAAEVFLACVIEDTPEEDYNNEALHREEFGLEYDQGSDPTAYWKSPIHAFLQIDSSAALDSFEKLIGFCTERWIARFSKGRRSELVSISLEIDNKTSRTYYGNHQVLDWPQSSSAYSGQLFCALAALEHWLCRQLDAQADITPSVSRLLRSTNCVGVIGVLLNVGKYRPSLLLGPLRLLTACHELYLWDEYRVTESRPYQFMPTSWVREGEAVFQMARDWYAAPYRGVSLQALVTDLLERDPEFASVVATASQRWVAPEGWKQELEFRILQAQLNATNYEASDASGAARRFVLPSELQARVEAFERAHRTHSRVLMLPLNCRRFLDGSGDLGDANAAALAAFLSGPQDGEADADDEQHARVAAACTLRARGSAWLEGHRGELECVEQVIRTAAAALCTRAWSNDSHRSWMRDQDAFFLAHAAVGMLVEPRSATADARDVTMAVLTSGDEAAGQALSVVAFDRRAEMGEAVWVRLRNIGILWAGLLALHPRSTEGGRETWGRWLQRFRSFALSGGDDKRLIRPADLAARVARLYERRAAREDGRERHGRFQRRSHGLDDQALKQSFAWLFGGRSDQRRSVQVSPELAYQSLLMQLEFELWRRARQSLDDDVLESGRRNASRDEPPSSLGYEVLHTAGRLLPELSLDQASDLWKPILAEGSDSHYFVRNFLDAFLLEMPNSAHLERATQQWRAMIEYALESWRDHGSYYYREQLLAQLLGCGKEASFDQRPELMATIRGMTGIYERWARAHLARDEDNIAWFCGLLSAKTWSGLRLIGLVWLQAALCDGAPALRWSRDSAKEGLVAVLNIALHQDVAALRSDPDARSAFLLLLNLLISRQVTAALALQERALRSLAR